MLHTVPGVGQVGMFLWVHAPFNAHLVYAGDDGIVAGVDEMALADIRMNGGFFVFKRGADEIGPEEELVEQPLGTADRAQGAARPIRYDGFFRPMDTIKDRQIWRRCTIPARRPGAVFSAGLEADAGRLAG